MNNNFDGGLTFMNEQNLQVRSNQILEINPIPIILKERWNRIHLIDRVGLFLGMQNMLQNMRKNDNDMH